MPSPEDLFSAGPDLNVQVKRECESGEIGCVDCKTRLAGLINEFFGPMRERREKLAKDPDRVQKLLEHGNLKARKTAKQTLKDVQEIMGLICWSDK